MKKKKKYLTFYMECMETGYLPKRGLCHSIGDPVTSSVDPTAVIFTNKELALFSPEFPTTSYWGFDYTSDSFMNLMFGFTPLRQTIVLFLAAMNNEL